MENGTLSFYHGSAALAAEGPPNPNPFWYLYKKMRTDGRLLSKADPMGRKILNVGCFYPYDELMYGSLVGKWVAVDKSRTAVERARREFERCRDGIPDGRVTFCVMDASDLRFLDGEFEIVLCLSVIEHISDREVRRRIIAELARVSSRYVIITSTDIDDDGYREFHGSRRYREFYGDDFYEKLYSKKELLDEIRSSAPLRAVEYAQFGPRMGYLLVKEDLPADRSRGGKA
jgi:ubiquinone/menaquinone biosynthesis C-methylase UbiE